MIIIDQLNRQVQLTKPASRIISLVPSLTEYLYDLELDDKVVGLTKFCIKPEEWFKSKERVGGTKQVNVQKVEALKPDLIIANKEENSQNDIEKLQSICPVYISDINNFDHAFSAMNAIGVMCDRSEKAAEIIALCHDKVKKIKSLVKGTCLYAIWKDPIMFSGQDNYINSVLKHMGLINAAEKVNGRYPILSDKIDSSSVDYILLSSEPFPFNDSHSSQFQKLFPNSKILLVDGEAFSWYGSRIYKSYNYFRTFAASLTYECQ